MKNYIMVSEEELFSLLQAFSDSEEFECFMNDICLFLEESLFNNMMSQRVDNKHVDILVMKQLCMLAMFCRDNIELIHQLIKCLKGKKITQEELEEYKKRCDTE